MFRAINAEGEVAQVFETREQAGNVGGNAVSGEIRRLWLLVIIFRRPTMDE